MRTSFTDNMGIDKFSKKVKAIKTFLIWQVVVALVLLIGFWYLQSDYAFLVVFFIELYAVSKLEDGLITLPESVIRYENIYENGTDAIASVVNIESTGRVSESGGYYIFTVALDTPSVELVIEAE